MEILLYVTSLISSVCATSHSQSERPESKIRYSQGAITNNTAGANDWQETIRYNSTEHEELIANIHWKFVDSSEPFEVIRAAKDFQSKGIDSLVLLDTLQYSKLVEETFLNLRRPIIQWFEEKTPDTEELELLCSTNNNIVPHEKEKITTCLPVINADGKDGIMVNTTLLDNPVTAMLSSIMDSLKWSSVLIVYENITAEEARVFSDVLSDRGATVIIYNIDSLSTSDDVHILLQNVYNATISGGTNVTVLCQIRCINRIITEAAAFDERNSEVTAMRHYSKWMIAVHGETQAESLKDCAASLDNVAVVTIPERYWKNNGENDKDLSTTIRDILQLVGERNRTENETEDTRKNDILQLLTQELSMQDVPNACSKFPIDTLMWTASGRGFSTVGYVETYGWLFLHSNIFPNIDMGLNQRKFIIGTNLWHPFVMELDGNVTNRYIGFTMDLLAELSKTLNFSYELVKSPDGEWGTLNENGTWTGLVGQLQNLEVDMVFAPLSNTGERAQVIDFAYPYFYDYTTVMLSKPDPNKTKWRTLIDPFNWQVLLCIGITLPVMSAFLWLCEKYNPYYSNVPNRNELNGLHKFQDSFWYLYGSLLTQGGVHLPKSQTGRTLISFWWLFSIVVVGTYSGNLIAFLTVNKDNMPFDSLEEMFEQSEYSWGTVGGTVWITLFSTSRLPVYENLWKRIVEFNKTDPSVLSSSLDVHFRHVMTAEFAFVGDKTSMEIKMANSCNLVRISEEFAPMQYAIALPKNSPYTRRFSEQMIAIHESGLLQIWKRSWWPKMSFCSGSSSPQGAAINIIDMQSAFYLIGIGIVLGCFALMGEYLYNCRKKCSSPTNNELTEISTSKVADAKHETSRVKNGEDNKGFDSVEGQQEIRGWF